MMRQDDYIRQYVACPHSSHLEKDMTSNVYAQNGILYSYGSHFWMAIPTNHGFLVNTDYYSSSTARHQSYVRNSINNPIYVSMDALKRAGLDMTSQSCKIVAHTPYQYGSMYLDPSNHKPFFKFFDDAPLGATCEQDNEGGETLRRWSRSSSLLIKKGDRYYLYSVDPKTVFIHKMRPSFKPVMPYDHSAMISQAYGELLPPQVKVAMGQGMQFGLELFRYLNWYFVRDANELGFKPSKLSTHMLVDKGDGGWYPSTTKGTTHNRRHFVTGMVRIKGQNALALSKNQKVMFRAYPTPKYIETSRSYQ